MCGFQQIKYEIDSFMGSIWLMGDDKFYMLQLSGNFW